MRFHAVCSAVTVSYSNGLAVTVARKQTAAPLFALDGKTIK